METQARIEAAKARLVEGRSLLVRAKHAGPPCIECRHVVKKYRAGPYGQERIGPFCGHPALTRQNFNPVDGVITHEIDVTAERARKDLCGLDGLLFERPTRLARFVKSDLGVASLMFVGGGVISVLAGFF